MYKKKTKKTRYLLVLITLLLLCYQGFLYLSTPLLHKVPSLHNTKPLIADLSKPRILLLNITNALGGQEMHTLTLAKMLHNKGYHVSLLIPYGGKLGALLAEHNIQYYQTHAQACKIIRPLYYRTLARSIQQVCTQENIGIIHCNNPFEIRAAQMAIKAHPAKVLLTLHGQELSALTKIKNIDALVLVNQTLVAPVIEANSSQNQQIKAIHCIPPFFNIDQLQAYKPTTLRREFFKQTYDINVEHDPIITMIGNFYTNILYKNHPLLLKAIHTLVYKKQKKIHVMLAGNGERLEETKKLAQELNLTSHVHFLGFTNKIPDLIHHSDIIALTSSLDACPLVLMEAGIMNRPTIAAYGTGGQSIIVHGKTGLLFKNGDVDDLVAQLETLLDKPLWAQQLGLNAHDHIMKNFSPASIFSQYEKLYQSVIN